MDTISSSEFRKRFASIKEDCFVTVNGHIIGAWVPRGTKTELPASGPIIHPGLASILEERAKPRPFQPVLKKEPTLVPPQEGSGLVAIVRGRDVQPGPAWRRPPFTPAPKKGK